MSDKKEDKKELSQDVQGMASKLKEFVAYDNESKSLVVTKGAAEAVMPEGVSKDTINGTFNFIRDFAAASAKVVGETSIPVMKKDSEIESLTATFPIVKGVAVEQRFSRQFTSFAPPKEKGGEKTEIVRHGRIDTSLNYNGAKAGSNKELRVVREELYAEGEKAFGKK